MKKGRLLNEHSFVVALLLAIAAYTIIWSWITLNRLYTLNVLWADFGISIEQMWLTFHNNWSVMAYLYVFFNEGLNFILSPLSLPGNFQLLLVVQSFALGITALPLYTITVNLLKNKKLALFVAIMYLVYFPISGLNWYDFHNEAFFPLFFLSGYMFYLKDRKILSSLFFFMSAIVRFPYAAFLLIFAIVSLLEKVFEFRETKIKLVKHDVLFLFFLLSLSAFLLIGAYLLSGTIAYPASVIHYSGNLGTSVLVGLLTFFYVFLPLAFLPLLSKKWFLTYIPYFVITVLIGGYGFDIPTAFHYQYTALIAPFVFLGFIDILGTLTTNSGVSVKSYCRFFKNALFRHRKALILSVAALTISSGVLFEPYSPINKYTFDNFDNFGNYAKGNVSDFRYLSQVISLIPKNNNSVLTQANLPEIYPRPESVETFPNSIEMLVAGDISNLQFSNNLTLSNFKNNSYGVITYSGIPYTERVYNVSIDYALAYTHSPWYYAGPPSMRFFVNMMNESGKYGTVAEYHGFILLEWGYKGKVKLTS